MKTLVHLVLLILMCILQQSSAGPLGPSALMWEDCCSGYNKTFIPKRRVTHVAMTLRSCSQEAIIVTTVCRKTKQCLDPDWPWAKKLLADYQKVGKKSPFAQFNSSKCENRV
ncbi:C-C motif chemokine 22-like [Pempheris klunzingeri]|uniref:C-C motif chemokine 22-like n=1 Tax=Pempheris klunzingeri TaxID=3127111 RepID=UPI0039800D30